MNLLKIPADDSLLQEQHFLIRKAIPRQKDVNENSNERVRAHNGERERTHIQTDGFAKSVRGVKITKRRVGGGGGGAKRKATKIKRASAVITKTEQTRERGSPLL